jgi:SAM-dependent methyltransferase
MDADGTQLESHFAFGKNWAEFARELSDDQIDEAVAALKRLLACESLAGKRFIDIGCGSGIHSLAALRIGADEVVAVDIDPDSVNTTRALLEKHAANLNWRVSERSVFGLSPVEAGRFDVVYSWGVLHHSGDLERAVAIASKLVANNGVFVVALYARTLLCPFWTAEKRWYSRTSPRAQNRARAAYILLYRLRSIIRLKSFKTHVATYAKQLRGMNFYRDVHDWMGGYPFQSISAKNVDKLMQSLNFTKVRVESLPAGTFASLGIFGTSCTEFVYRARPAAASEGELTMTRTADAVS